MRYKKIAVHTLKVVVTCGACAVAGILLWQLYIYYTYVPQTRDGRVRADVVPISSDVSGQVQAVFVHDNQQVHRGDLLFSIDKARFKAAVAQAHADLADAKIQRDAAIREYSRYKALDENVVPARDKDNHRSDAQTAKVRYARMQSNLDLARINLSRTDVHAPVNGIVTNFTLRKGIYAATGNPVMTLVDTDSFYIVGYFEETKLKNIHAGMTAQVHVMGERSPLTGHVTGLSAGIEDRDVSTAGTTLLPNVNPTFKWVRLAQRIPVRIAIDKAPADLVLVAGRTVSIRLDTPDTRDKNMFGMLTTGSQSIYRPEIRNDPSQ